MERELDREALSRRVKTKALRVPCRQSSSIRDRVRRYLLGLPRVKPIIADPDSITKKLILLDPSVSRPLPREVASAVDRDGVEFMDYELTVGYDRRVTVEILREILPDGITVPTAFESIGRVAHINLRPEHEPYKRRIAQVLLDKNPSIGTVVNKLGTVENDYRLMETEILAGEPSLLTEVRQSGCRFEMDFGKVYWNSRLEYEHHRLVDQFRPGETVLDLFAGIGPFSIPAAKKGCTVMANDKNPESYKYLQRNITLNGAVGKIFPFNLDARECLSIALGQKGPLAHHLPTDYEAGVKLWRSRRRKRPRNDNEWTMPPLPLKFQHVVMNYPKYAVDFLSMFRGGFTPNDWSPDDMPRIHCYTFKRQDEDVTKIKTRCERELGADITTDIHIVRDVSPSKVMCCVSFTLPHLIATSQR